MGNFFNRPRHKYGAKRTEFAGYSFASKLEAAVFQMLTLLEKAGEIKDIQVQDHIKLTDAKILYIADFKIFDLKLNEFVWVEAKGFVTSDWKLKKRLWAKYGPGILRIYMGTASRIFLDEEVKPTNYVQEGGVNYGK